MYNYKKIIAGITAVVTSASTFAVCGISSASAVNAKTDTVKIMSVGDSITHGYINGDNGYRKYFNYYLQQNGITNFDMVGPNNSWTNSASYNWNGTSINYDPQHAGYSGYAIQSTGGRTGIQETIFNNTYSNNGVSGNMLEAYDPDIIMLQIGTNDLLDCQLDGIGDRLEELVDLILPYVSGEGEMLYLASVPDIDVDVRYDWLNSYSWKLGYVYSENPEAFSAAVQSAVDNYNITVRNLVAEKQAEGYNIGFTDINSVVDVKSGLDDGCHPNEDGYSCMGKLWAETLTETYFGGQFEEVTPVVTTAKATTTTTSTTTKATTTTTAAVTTTTTAKTSAATTTAKPVSKPVTGGSVVLDDVKIGESYDISAYGEVKSVSFVFNKTPQYGMNGCVAFGNWELSTNYDASMLVDNTLTVELDKAYNSLTIHKWYGDTDLDSVILHTGDVSETTTENLTTTTTTTTTAKPTTTTTTTTTAKPTTTTTTTTTTKPTTTTTTTTTTAKPTTTTTTTTTTKPTTTTTTATTTKPVTTTESVSSGESRTVVLTDVSVGEEYSLKDYNYADIKKIVVKFDENVGYGFNGSLVLGNWSVSNSYTSSDMKSDNTIEFEVTNAYDKMTVFRYWGSVGIESVTLVY